MDWVTTRKKAAFVGPQVAQDLWDPAAGMQVLLTHLVFTVSVACHVTIYGSGDAANPIIDQDFDAGGGYGGSITPPLKFAKDEVLKITTTAGNCTVTMLGTEVKAF